MKESNSIPVSKVARASKIVSTGIKLGGNYVKHYSKKMVGTGSESELNQDNAETLYSALGELKGSALKMAQMLSMEGNVLPKEYQNQFQLAQYSAPPLSGPLVVKTFEKSTGKKPLDVFDSFDMNATNAASIGQVHKATLNGENLAIKIQYPGVADSIQSDLRLIKPFALKYLNVSGNEADIYFKEVESKLLEEADYNLELERSSFIREKCNHIDSIVFPKYFEEFSSGRVLAMSWLEGEHLSEWFNKEQTQEDKNKIGQALWNFYMFQLHKLKMVQADPHPGNFLVTKDIKLGAIDFGCVKEIPEDFYQHFARLLDNSVLNDPIKLNKHLEYLEILLPTDSEEIRAFFTKTFHNMISLLAKPFNMDSFDFSDKTYFDEIISTGYEVQKLTSDKKYKTTRGSKHFLYVNRTFYGLYNLLHLIGSEIKVTWK